MSKKHITVIKTALIIIFFLTGVLSRGHASLKRGMNTIAVPDRHGSKKSRKIYVDIYVPGGDDICGDLLVLPGWNFSRKRWHRETELLKLAERYDYRAVFPEMRVTSYESEYFPETTMKWAPMPGGKWVREILLPHLQKKHGIFKKGNRNFLLGLSTGGRGVLLVALQNPGLFYAGATLSGDSNQCRVPEDRLMTRQYGPFGKHKKRWRTVDNPEESAKKGQWQMPLYIGHGRKDRVCPYSQSLSLYKTLKKYYPDLKVVFNGPKNAGHNFKYWNSELRPVFRFFESIE